MYSGPTRWSVFLPCSTLWEITLKLECLSFSSLWFLILKLIPHLQNQAAEFSGFEDSCSTSRPPFLSRLVHDEVCWLCADQLTCVPLISTSQESGLTFFQTLVKFCPIFSRNTWEIWDFEIVKPFRIILSVVPCAQESNNFIHVCEE